jgi:hypothetical protein
MRIVVLLLWAAGAFYSTLCVFIPELRPAVHQSRFWTGRDKKVGLLSCVGVATFFWLPLLTYGAIVTGLLHERYMLAVYWAAVLGVVVATVGGLIDIID